MLKKSIIRFFISLLIIFFFCGEKGEKTMDEKLRSIISHVPASSIERNGKIQVRFNQSVVSESRINLPEKEKLFEFDPPIKGSAVFLNQRLLVFTPEEPLEIKKTYQGKLIISSISAALKKYPDLEFKFQVSARKIALLQHDLYPLHPDKPSPLVLKGKIKFTDKVSRELIEKNIYLSNENKISLDWKADKDEKTYRFISQPIDRKKKKQILSLEIIPEELELSGKIQEKIIIPPIQELELTGVKFITEKNQRINLNFSEDLSISQDINGLISVFTPQGNPVQIKTQKLENTLFVDGPFSLGQTYAIRIEKGLKGRLGSILKSAIAEEITFNDYKPQILFNEKGCILPTSENKKIYFKSINVKQVRLEINKVYESNLGFFLQEGKLTGQGDNRYDYTRYSLKRVGELVVDTTLSLSMEKNRWLRHRVDLAKLIPAANNGLYIIKLKFLRQDMLYSGLDPDKPARYYYGDDYYTNPLSMGYIYRNGEIRKPLIISDIGLIYKRIRGKTYVIANDIETARPLSGVDIKLYSFQNQVIGEGKTNEQGMAVFDLPGKEAFYLTGEKNSQRTIIQTDVMRNNLSTFDISGIKKENSSLTCYAYTERDVYIPGDTINFSIILRNTDHTFPQGHPVKMSVYNPKNRLIAEKINKNGKDGFYHFAFKTDPNSLTGAWRGIIQAGNSTFTHSFKVETIIPYRLKVDIASSKEKIQAHDDEIQLEVYGEYLFGQPCAGLTSNLDIDLFHKEKTFKKYKDYVFNNQLIDFQTINILLGTTPLNREGKRTLSWEIPHIENAPSALEALITAEVFEKGGRPVPKRKVISYDPYPFYIGIKAPESDWGYLPTNEDLKFSIVASTPDGAVQSGENLSWKLYRNSSHWWWEFDSKTEFQKRFKRSKTTELLEEGALITKETPSLLTLKTKKRGEYLLEVTSRDPGGHKCAIFFQSSPWGRESGDMDGSGLIALKSDKDKYKPGEKAVISFPAPNQGTVFYSLESGEKMLDWKWLTPRGENNVMSIEVPVRKDMAPNVYFNLYILQPHRQTLNDRPVRLFGIIPINVEASETHTEISIKAPEKIEPLTKLKIELSNQRKEKTQYTIAVVDEGLLNITNYKTPSPWMYFYQKQGFYNDLADNYSEFIGARKGDIFQTFSIGGGLSLDAQYRQSQMNLRKEKQIESVSFFKGPFESDRHGKAEIEFSVPDYTGSLRIMAVSASREKYGSEEKNVTVTRDVIIMPYLPRHLGPKEKTIIPVSIIATKENIGEVELSLNSQGPIRVAGPNGRRVSLSRKEEKTVEFTVNSFEEIGNGVLEFTARFKGKELKKTEKIPVRAASPRVYHAESHKIEKNRKKVFSITPKGLNGSFNGRLVLKKTPNFNINHRIDWLTRYPYGCLEQTVSSVFSQLSLYKIPYYYQKNGKEYEKNINSAIERTKLFQRDNGGLSYWPNGRSQNNWSETYAFHFLWAAGQEGFHVPDALYKRLAAHLTLKAKTDRAPNKTQLYRLYVLALTGEPLLGPMNFIYTNYLNELDQTELYLLAGAYFLSGEKGKAYDIARMKTVVNKSPEYDETFGTELRNQSIRLLIAKLMNINDTEQRLKKSIGQAISGNDWYSTQSLGFSIMAVSETLKEAKENKSVVKGKINGEEFSITEEEYVYPIGPGEDKEITVEINDDSPGNNAWAYLSYSYLPIRGSREEISQGLKLQRTWYDDSGRRINIQSLPSNTGFWCQLRVSASSDQLLNDLDHLALTQIFPAGWEVENPRIISRKRPSWAKNLRLNNEEYLDIRENRLLYFFKINDREPYQDFLFYINTVNKGEYFLPPVISEDMYHHETRAQSPGEFIQVF